MRGAHFPDMHDPHIGRYAELNPHPSFCFRCRRLFPLPSPKYSKKIFVSKYFGEGQSRDCPARLLRGLLPAVLPDRVRAGATEPLTLQRLFPGPLAALVTKHFLFSPPSLSFSIRKLLDRSPRWFANNERLSTRNFEKSQSV